MNAIYFLLWLLLGMGVGWAIASDAGGAGVFIKGETDGLTWLSVVFVFLIIAITIDKLKSEEQ